MASADPEPDQRPVTELLDAHLAGDGAALEEVLQLLYGELHALAGAVFSGRGHGSSLQPTALVHEAWLKFGRADQQPSNRRHFLAVAAMAMRQVLSDHLRAQRTLKRGSGARPVTLVDVDPEGGSNAIDPLELEEALLRLEELNERHARIVELRFFGALTVDEVAEELDLSPRTVRADWAIARAWLRRELEAG